MYDRNLPRPNASPTVSFWRGYSAGRASNRMKTNKRTDNRTRRRARIRAKLSGTKAQPRLSVFRSNRSLYAQLIDDEKGVTLCAVSDMGIKAKTKTLRAKEAGKLLAKAALGKKIKSVVFDRGGFAYAGRVRALAEGAREGGLKF